MSPEARHHTLKERILSMRRYRRRVYLFSTLAGLFVFTFSQLPWNSVVEAQLKRSVTDAGLVGLDFQVQEANLSRVTLANLSYQGQALQELAFSFRPLELMRGGLGRWQATEMALTFGAITIGLTEVDLQFPPHGEGEGEWRMNSIDVQNAPLLVPPLTGSGTLSLAEDAMTLEGRIASTNGTVNAEFMLRAPRHAPQETTLTLKRAQLPWNGGTLETGDVRLVIMGRDPVPLTLALKNVSVDALLKQAVGGAALASGGVTGRVPLRISRDGTLHFGQGELSTAGEGIVQLPPSLIPGDQPQVELVRDVLSDFHYERFAMTIEEQKGKKLSILLSLQGKNPQVYNGRKIHLNVRLNGDLLSLLSQSLSIINDPQQLIPKE